MVQSVGAGEAAKGWKRTANGRGLPPFRLRCRVVAGKTTAPVPPSDLGKDCDRMAVIEGAVFPGAHRTGWDWGGRSAEALHFAEFSLEIGIVIEQFVADDLEVKLVFLAPEGYHHVHLVVVHMPSSLDKVHAVQLLRHGT